MANVKVNGAGTTKRVVFVAGPGTEILDLVGPLQVFARASDMHCRAHPDADPIYSTEVVSLGPRRSLIATAAYISAPTRPFAKRAVASIRYWLPVAMRS